MFPRDAHLEFRVVLADALSLARAARAAVSGTRLTRERVVGGSFGFERGWNLAAEDGQAAGGVSLLHALLVGFLAGPSLGLVAPHAGNVVGVVDVP